MSVDRVIDRIRAANPAPAVTVTDEELFARIVAGPGDARLGVTASSVPRRRRLRMGTRGLALVAAAAVLTTALPGSAWHPSRRACRATTPWSSAA